MKKTFYRNHNQKALDIINRYSNQIFSYLNADPKKVNFNHIVTVPVSNRNENNGFPNFRFDVNEVCGLLTHYNVRVETNTFQDDFIIETSKVAKISKSEILIFEANDSIYISELDNWGNRNWLTDKRFFYQKRIEWPTGCKTYNYYNFRNLLANGQITQILHDKIDDKIVVVSNLDFLLDGQKNTRVCKPYYDYNISTAHITQVQYDGKQPKTMFWCTGNERYTKNVGSSTKIAEYLMNLSILDAKSIYQRVTRVYNKMMKEGKAFSTKIPANPKIIGNLNYDQSMIDEDNNITIYVSNDPNFDVIENAKVKKSEDYGNKYRKVKKWIKENPNNLNFPKKWDDECLEIAKKIMERQNGSI